MADKETREEVEHYYKSNPSKPKAVKQYDKPIGPEHPHANVKTGKEQGPTRADLEKEKQRKFKKDFQIESDANAARLRGEKEDARVEAKRKKEAETEKREKERERERPERRKKTTTYRKEPRETRRKEPRGGRAESRRQNVMPQAPSFRMGDFLPDMGVHYQASPMSIMPPIHELPFTGGLRQGPAPFGSAPRPRGKKKRKSRRQSSGINFGFTNPNYIPPGLKKFF